MLIYLDANLIILSSLVRFELLSFHQSSTVNLIVDYPYIIINNKYHNGLLYTGGINHNNTILVKKQNNNQKKLIQL